jgi:hypothetical protein
VQCRIPNGRHAFWQRTYRDAGTPHAASGVYPIIRGWQLIQTYQRQDKKCGSPSSADRMVQERNKRYRDGQLLSVRLISIFLQQHIKCLTHVPYLWYSIVIRAIFLFISIIPYPGTCFAQLYIPYPPPHLQRTVVSAISLIFPCILQAHTDGANRIQHW